MRLHLALVGLLGCTDVNLYGKVGQAPQLIDKIGIVGTLCTDNPATRQFPVKILFVVDGSGQMFDTAAAGEHVNAIEQTISQFLPIANVFLGVIKYGDEAITLVSEQVGTINSGYTRDAAMLDQAISQLRNGGGARDLDSAMSLARSIITGDAFQADLGPLSRTKYVVVHVMSGSPAPAIQGNRCEDFDPVPMVCEPAYFEELVRDLRDQVLSLGAAEFVFHSIFIEPPHVQGAPCDPRDGAAGCNGVPGLACVQTGGRIDSGRCARLCNVDGDCIDPLMPICASSALADGTLINSCASGEFSCFDGLDNDNDGRIMDCSDPAYPYGCGANNGICENDCRTFCRAEQVGLGMALATGGRYERFASADQTNFGKIDLRSTQRLFVLKEFLAFNRNTIATERGFATDSDADGLSDAEEAELALTPQSEDTDGDFYNDRLEHLLRTLGLDPLVPNVQPDCDDPTIDTDGDGLYDCEEKLLGSDRTLFDTDADGYPDHIEFRTGTNPLFNDNLDDIDLDGVNNGREITAHTDALSNDARVRAELAYRYRTTDLGVTTDQRSCYDFRVSNITLMETLDRGFGAGNNIIDVYFGQVPDGALETYGVFHVTQVPVNYLSPDSFPPDGRRDPDTAAIEVREEDFVSFDQ
jgi:hypothetical protein